MTKKVAIFAAAVMSTLLALLVLWQFRMVVIYVFISLMLAATLRPLTQRLKGRGPAARLAWIFLYLVVLAGFGFALFLTGESTAHEIQQLAETVSEQDEWILPPWLDGSAFQQLVGERLPAPSQIFEVFTGEQGQLVVPAILGFSQGIGGFLSAAFVILFLSIYWSINQIHFERLWLSLLPSDRRTQARDIWRTIEPDIGAYIRAEIIESLLAGLFLGLGYWLIGSPYPVLLGLTGALTSLVPVVGWVLTLFSVLLVGLLTSNVQLSLLTVLYTFVVLTAMFIWLKPRLFPRSWNNPVLTVVLLIALADAFGLVGVIIAPPISVTCQILWHRLVSHRAVSGAATQLSDLKERQARAWENIRAIEEPAIPLVNSSMGRLSQLIEKAEPLLQAGPPAKTADPNG